MLGFQVELVWGEVGPSRFIHGRLRSHPLLVSRARWCEKLLNFFTHQRLFIAFRSKELLVLLCILIKHDLRAHPLLSLLLVLNEWI